MWVFDQKCFYDHSNLSELEGGELMGDKTRKSAKIDKAVKVKKVTWEIIYKEFRSRYPRLKKLVLGYTPYDVATILLIFPDHLRMIYDYDTKRLSILSST